jgi:Tfp pilus assembly protein PilN
MRRVEISTVVLLVGLFACGWAMLWEQRELLAVRVAAAERDAAQAFELREQLVMFEKERGKLYEQSSLYRRLEPRVRFAEALRIFGRALPESVGLTTLSVRQSDEKDPRIELSFSGLCHDDRQVADAVASLAADPLFSELEVGSVGPVESDDGPMRELSLDVRIDLSRRLTLVAEEVEP